MTDRVSSWPTQQDRQHLLVRHRPRGGSDRHVRPTPTPPGTYQALSATAGTTAQENAAGAALTQAGVYYSQVAKAATCNATKPVTAGPWKWGSTYSAAPQS